MGKLARAGIPKIERAYELDGLPPGARAKYERAWTLIFTGRDVFIHSEAFGNGKTALAVVLLKRAHDEGRTVRYVNVPAILDDFCARDENAVPPASQIRKWADTTSLILLDDLGGELRITDAVKKNVYLMLNTLRGHGTQMIITSNVGEHALADRYDQRIRSRLNAFNCLEVTGPDVRRAR